MIDNSNKKRGRIAVVSTDLIRKVDQAIKEIWINNIAKDYSNDYILKEDSLKCCFYYHIRRKLAVLLRGNNLRIYSEYYFSNLRYRADIAIVQIDPTSNVNHLRGAVTDVVAVIELKYAGGNAENTASWIKNDVFKIKNYIQSGLLCQYYFAVIYEAECEYLNWLDKRSTNHWAAGYVTELDAGYIDNEMKFEVNSYNEFNCGLHAGS